MEATATSRAEHLQWCKNRALEYARMGDASQALASMGSDLNQHDETRGHIGMELGMMQLMSGLFKSPADIVRFIEGFN